MLTTKSVLEFISEYIGAHGFSPSTRDISETFGCSTSTVNKMLKSLRSEGKITYIDGKNRTLRLVEDINENGIS